MKKKDERFSSQSNRYLHGWGTKSASRKIPDGIVLLFLIISTKARVSGGGDIWR